MREQGASRGLSSGGEAEGEGEWVVTGSITAGTRVLPGANGGEGEGEEVLEQVILGAVGNLLVHHSSRRCGRGWGGAPDMVMKMKKHWRKAEGNISFYRAREAARCGVE
jgi:hypothetical protein